MGDLKEVFSEMRQHRRGVKAQRQSKSGRAMEIFMGSRFDYITLSPGHLRVGSIIDWWPSTGTWIVLSTRQKGHGVRELLEYLEEVALNE